MVALATLEWDEDAQRAGEARSPGAGGEDDDRRTKLAFRSLDRDRAVATAQRERLRPRAQLGARLPRSVTDRPHVAQRIHVRLVGVVDAAGQLAHESRLEPPQLLRAEDLCPQTGPVGLELSCCEPRLRLVDAERPPPLEARPERGQLGVELQADEAERPDRARAGLGPLGPAGGHEACEPGQEAHPRPHEGAVRAHERAHALAESRRRGERHRVAGADQPRIPGRASGRQSFAPLEQRDACAAARELERGGRPDRAAADDDDVRLHPRENRRSRRSSGIIER